MTRRITAAAIAAAALIGWFVLSIHRLASQLSVTAEPSEDATSQYDDGDIVGMPTVIRFYSQPIDWDAFFDTAGRLN